MKLSQSEEDRRSLQAQLNNIKASTNKLVSNTGTDSMRSSVYVTVWVCPSFCLSHLTTSAAACLGFAVVGPVGRRYRSVAARPQLRAVPRCQLTSDAEQELVCCVLHSLLGDQGLITEQSSVCIPVSVGRLGQNRGQIGSSYLRSRTVHAAVAGLAELVPVCQCGSWKTSQYGVTVVQTQ